MKMKISKVIGPTKWGPIEVELICSKCGHVRRAMRYQAKRGLRCSKCTMAARQAKKLDEAAKRKPRNVSGKGIALGAAPASGPTWVVLEQMPSSKLRIRLCRELPGNAGPRMRYGVLCADRDIAVAMLDLFGRELDGDFLTLACRIRDMHAALGGGMM